MNPCARLNLIVDAIWYFGNGGLVNSRFRCRISNLVNIDSPIKCCVVVNRPIGGNMEGESALQLREPASLRPSWFIGSAIVIAVALAGIALAKWWPYSHKLADLLTSRTWSGGSIFNVAGPAGADPSIHGALQFTVAYIKSIWLALIVGLAIASAVEAFLPKRWLLGLMGRKAGFGSSVVGGLLAVPCMMCTCCGAPIVATLKREGVPVSGSLAFWVGNPTLNPAVVAFLILVAPWQWVLTRIVVGVLLVFGVTAIVAHSTRTDSASESLSLPSGFSGDDFSLGEAPRRFARALVRMCLTLLPEYLVVVVLLGLFRGWLFPFGSATDHWGIWAVLLAVAVGTMMVIPTAGEIPILLGLSSIGAGPAVIGALLITLPAISLPSMAMVSRSISVKVTALMAAGVAAAGLVSGAFMWLLFH